MIVNHRFPPRSAQRCRARTHRLLPCVWAQIVLSWKASHKVMPHTHSHTNIHTHTLASVGRAKVPTKGLRVTPEPAISRAGSSAGKAPAANAFSRVPSAGTYADERAKAAETLRQTMAMLGKGKNSVCSSLNDTHQCATLYPQKSTPDSGPCSVLFITFYVYSQKVLFEYTDGASVRELSFVYSRDAMEGLKRL